MNIEELYQEFYQDNIKGNKYIDFIGINVSSDYKYPFVFKTYRHIGTKIEQRDGFLDLLENKNMIKNYLPIISSDVNRIQYDVRLANRRDENMEEVFRFLSFFWKTVEDMSDANLSEIQHYSKMCITDLPDYTMSSLYFLGLLWDHEKLAALKAHFLTRKVNNPDHFSDGFWYDDKYFLDYIRTSNNKVFRRIADITADILGYISGHLWMFGVDGFSDTTAKYKIYLQEPKGFDLNNLAILLGKYKELDGMRSPLKELCVWLKSHSELLLYGFAITVTSKEEYGFNLYFIPPSDLRGTT